MSVSRSVQIGVVVVVLAAAAAFFVFRPFGGSAEQAAMGGAPGGGGHHQGQAQGGRPVPVLVVPVVQKDVPIYLDGLGTVQAYKTVTVHSRVDGQLTQINFREGQDVHANDALAHIDDSTYRAQFNQTVATRDKDQAQLDAARRDLERYVMLKDRVSGQTVDTQRALVRQLDATIRADQAAADNARAMLSYTVISSPIDGRTGLRLVDEGNIIHAADAGGLVVLTQLQPIAVIFTLPQQVLPSILQLNGQGADLPVLAAQSDNKTIIDRGRLELVDNQIDQTTGTVRLKAVMPNAGRRLWPGGFVNVRLLVDTAKAGLVIPAAAVQRGPQGAYAFVVKDDHTVEMRVIQVTQVESDEALVASGLTLGDRVVADGASKLQSGARVTEVAPQAQASPSPATPAPAVAVPDAPAPAASPEAHHHHQDGAQ